ncbi:MAG: hypothetical protein F6K54_23690 [Okeania sp. SIO3B5]|uniref:hypothetical protein n=1 Tax=Okeania sp. SIO3B5 TaxID=2607811 RepID=UPI0013FF7AFF|nr:hypothetical protein [Okeania sp. SIO3B5]NEO55805.1 hypothetical protein [Okeania sp. SIO3B5]
MSKISFREMFSETKRINRMFPKGEIWKIHLRLPFFVRICYTLCYAAYTNKIDKIEPINSTKWQIVDQLIKDNLDQIDDNFLKLLKSGAIELFLKVLARSPNQAEVIAACIVDFGGVLCLSSHGDKARNVEIAIAVYRAATTVFTREAYPEYWANIQNDLGNTYCHRIHGEKAQNLESAIKYYKNALEVSIGKNREDLAIIQRLFNEQIQSYLSYCQHGTALLEKAMTTMQGRVDIEQAQSNGAFQNTIAIIGVGLTSAAVGATVAPYIIAAEPQKPILPPFSSKHPHPFTQALFLIIVFYITGIVFTLIIHKIIARRRITKL